MTMPATNIDPIAECETLLAAGKVKEALKLYKLAMESAPPQAEFWINYSSFLYRCGAYEDSAYIAQKAVNLDPRAEAFHNLASAQKALGQSYDAIESYKKAIHHNPDFGPSHHDLATCYEDKNMLDYAVDHYQIAVALNPRKALYWFNLAKTRKALGRFREALNALRFTLTQQQKPQYYSLMYDIFAASQDFDINSTLIANVVACYESKADDPMKLVKISQKIFFDNNPIKTLRSKIEQNEIPNVDKLIKDKSLNLATINHPVILHMLTTIPILSADAETILITLRAYCLETIISGNAQDKIWPDSDLFISSLACQCYLNEFVFFEDLDETEHLKKLETRIQKNLNEGTEPDYYELCIYACYRPLYKLENIENYLYEKENKDIDDLIRIHVKEPLREAALKSEIETFTNVDNKVSKIVKEQYEQNPYPFWVQHARLSTHPLKFVLQHLFRHMQDEEFNAINHEAPSILMAGCGTGRQAIETALSIENANVTAIDLSSSSLAYALRKTEEESVSVSNITYGIADILKLRDMNKQFDVITCTGVLHHMENPMEGWKALCEVLKPGGFMRIALYSEIARKSVVAARDFIAEQGLQPDIEGIRMCRSIIRNLAEDHPIKLVMRWMDFYTASTCRDLIFHAMEHRYTCEELGRCLDELNLDFMGFTTRNPEVMPRFTAAYPDDPYALNLENWAEFEINNPAAFSEMYQFWVQKPE